MIPNPKSILVRAPNWIGDQVLAYPFFYYLRRAWPHARITAVCVDWVADLQYRDLVDEVYVLPRPLEDGLISRFRAVHAGARELRARGGWDLGIALPNSFSAGWLLYASGSRQRRGYRTEGRGWLLNDGVIWDANPARHRAQAYLDLLPAPARPERPAREFWGIYPEDELDPMIAGELKEFQPLHSWPHAKDAPLPKGLEREPYWVIAPGATASSRRWGLDRFANLVRTISSATGWRGVVVGGAKEAALFQELQSLVGGGLTDCTALGPPSSTWRIFKNAKFTVCNESGLSHLAALCGSSVHIICGAADPRRTKPLGPGRVQVSVNAVECWPCEKNSCFQSGEKVLQCLRGIAHETVWEEIRRGFGGDQHEWR